MTKVVYLIRTTGKGKDEKSFFTRQGVAFENRDGSLNVKLDLFPGLTFHIRDPKDHNEVDENTEP